MVSPTTSHAAVELLIASGIDAESRGDLATAERNYRQAIEADPSSPSAHMNLGILMHANGDFTHAAAEHSLAVSLDPASGTAHYNLGLARLELGQHAAAAEAFRSALGQRADFPEAWVGLADVLESQGEIEKAIEALEAAIAGRPGYAGAIFNIALLLRKQGRLDEAVARLREVSASDPDAANAATALGAMLRDQGRIAEAVDTLQGAARRFPDSGVARSELLFTRGYMDTLSAEDLFLEHLRAGRLTEESTPRWFAVFRNGKDPERVLRVGYLSGDFRGHSVSIFTELLFERHRRDRVIPYAYSSTAEHDATTARIIRSVHAWRDVRGQPDAAVAEAIASDGIDILVDLAGHTGFQRIGVLAGRAAPVQMTWLGYINTTGLARVDYRISDAVADPVGMADRLHTEKLLRMPHAQWCFRPPGIARHTSPVREPRSSGFTFGSFNQFPKVSAASIRLWIEVMYANPEAQLKIMGVPRGSAAESLSAILRGAGIQPSRFELVDRVPLEAYYLSYNKVDACLDTTPYSGGTTTCDALWMGVPVITLAGDRSMSRSTASLLTAMGMQHLVARTPAEYISIASQAAASGALSSPMRIQLRERMSASPLMDEAAFTRDLEGLYRDAWRRWCAQPSGAG